MASRLELRGEDIFLIPENRLVSSWLGDKGYRWLSIPRGSRGNGHRLLYGRVKFRLAHGYWPLEVDHKDRNSSNDQLSNLRAADRLGNCTNRVQKPRALPRGVYKSARGHGFYAAVKKNKVRHHLGYFQTPDDAAAAVRKFDVEHQGEFSPWISTGIQKTSK